MSDLVQFAKSVEDQLGKADREPHWTSEEAERYMAEVARRRERLEHVAARLNETVVQPRLETLASYFANASMTQDEPAGHCSCWFGYCERFPASTKVAFAVEHDVRYENAVVAYEATMVPVFIKFNEQDKLTTPLDELTDEAVSEWVEERLLEFLDAYLRIDRGGDDFKEEPATDPVCGMRISRSNAAACDSYRGHPYYFCSTDCQRKFSDDPTAYVRVKPL